MATLVAVPFLLGMGGDSANEPEESLAQTTTTRLEPETSADSLLADADSVDLLRAGPDPDVAMGLVFGGLRNAANRRSVAAGASAKGDAASLAPGSDTLPLPDTDPRDGGPLDPDTADTDGSAPGTAPNDTDVAPVTVPDDTVPQTTAPRTTTPPATTPPTTAPRTTNPPATAPPAAEPDAAEPPAAEPPAATEAPSPDPGPPAEPTAEQRAVLRDSEAWGSYTTVSANGLYRGAYQFSQGTWDNTARASGRTDLVGVSPEAASPADQDAMALSLWRRAGWSPWPTCGRRAAAL